MVAINLFSSALKSQRKSIAIQNVCDNARYILGFIAKEVRMGEIRTADGETATLDIAHPVNGDISYSFSGGKIIRTDATTSGAINPDEVRVEGRFVVEGRAAYDDEQPRVTIIMKAEGSGTKPEEQAEVNLQTTLSQGNFELD